MAPRPHFVSRSSRPRRFLAVLILAIVIAISAGTTYLFVRSAPGAFGPDGEGPSSSARSSSGGANYWAITASLPRHTLNPSIQAPFPKSGPPTAPTTAHSPLSR